MILPNFMLVSRFELFLGYFGVIYSSIMLLLHNYNVLDGTNESLFFYTTIVLCRSIFCSETGCIYTYANTCIH